jgi:hypothetical protein
LEFIIEITATTTILIFAADLNCDLPSGYKFQQNQNRILITLLCMTIITAVYKGMLDMLAVAKFRAATAVAVYYDAVRCTLCN